MKQINKPTVQLFTSEMSKYCMCLGCLLVKYLSFCEKENAPELLMMSSE